MAYPILEDEVQALVLCGPGASFDTLLSDQTPKCLALIANRPMVYYPLDFCKRSGITSKLAIINLSSLVLPFLC
jgi:translation initiation factor eIF-2B subunit gamma